MRGGDGNGGKLTVVHGRNDTSVVSHAVVKIDRVVDMRVSDGRECR